MDIFINLAMTEKKYSEIWKELMNIFLYYKKEYGLGSIELKQSFNNHFEEGTGAVGINLGKIVQLLKRNDYILKRTGYTNERINIICVLLHEIKHAIDYVADSNKWRKEKETLDMRLYHTDEEYHNSRPKEIRADEFARIEIKKWITKK